MAVLKEDFNDYKQLPVRTEQEFIDLVNEINTDIEFENISKSDADKQKTLDLNYLLKRYKTIQERANLKAFQEENDCKYCVHIKNSRRCFEKKKCRLEKGKGIESKINVQKPKCPRNKKGSCPYENEVGRCFGFCMQKIIEEYKEERRSEKQ